jgi:hypothetical protein
LFQPLASFGKKKSESNAGQAGGDAKNTNVRVTRVSPTKTEATPNGSSGANSQDTNTNSKSKTKSKSRNGNKDEETAKQDAMGDFNDDEYDNGGLPRNFGRLGILQGFIRIVQTGLAAAALGTMIVYFSGVSGNVMHHIHTKAC